MNNENNPTYDERVNLLERIKGKHQDCPFCNTPVSIEQATKPIRYTFYCDNADCPVKPCTEAKELGSAAYDWSQVKKGGTQ